MNYYLWIIGCQYNEWDGARIKYALSSLGLEESDAESVDIVVILACSVRQTAIDRIFGRIKNWPKKKIIVTGCVLDVDKKKFEQKGVKIIEQGNIDELIMQVKELSKRDPSSKVGMTCKNESKSYQLSAVSCNFVPIMIGCNNFCAYCAVPYTRGREKSRDFDEIVRDVKALINKYCSNPTGENSRIKNFSQGSKNKPFEIILLGQNVNSYAINDKSKVKSHLPAIASPACNDVATSGRLKAMQAGHYNSKSDNAKQKKDFTILLETLNALPGDFIISFISNHPKDMSDDIVTAVSTLPKVKKEIHLPLQSGSDKILKAMNRPYTKKQYLSIIKKIKEADPEIKISTDVIVGFPGETEKDFEETREVFKKVNYNMAYINKYSPRSGTAAFKLGDPIAWSEKQRRWHILNDIVYHKKN